MAVYRRAHDVGGRQAWIKVLDIESLQPWIGKQSVEAGEAAAPPLAGLAALLDHDGLPWHAGEVPPLGHWLYFLPTVPQSKLSEDGHPQRGGLLPPVTLPRRMWAGGHVRFHGPLRIGTRISRRSTVTDVTAKSGTSGEMVFVTVTHEIFDGSGKLCIEERQDLVYRGAGEIAGAPSGEPPVALASRYVAVNPALLFRFSALTFNAHRIHYDRDYATTQEGYPGLVVHGPLQAMLLVDHYRRQTLGARLNSFEFRARRPLFDGNDLGLHSSGPELWTSGPDGRPAMTARIT